MGSIAICGKPGGGKSFYAVLLLLTELLVEKRDGVFRNRAVITNVPLRLVEVAAFLEKNEPEYFAQMGNLPVHVIPISEEPDIVPEFWRYRDSATVPTHPGISAAEYKAGKRPDWTLNTSPVIYLLDELHKFLNSRNWQNTGPVVLDYMSQHRHFGDDVYWMTQAVKNVDSQFRSVTQEFRLVRNMQKEKFLLFRKGGGFRLSVYQDDRLASAQADYSKAIPFRKDVAKCYHTSIIGGEGDAGEKAKALPWWGIWLACFLLVVVIAWFGFFAPDLAARAVVGDVPEEEEVRAGVEGSGLVSTAKFAIPNSVPTVGAGGLALRAAGAGAGGTPPGAANNQVSTVLPLRSLTPDLVKALELQSITVASVPTANAVLLTGEKMLVAEAAVMISALDHRADTSSVSISAVIATVDLVDDETSGLSVLGKIVADSMPGAFRVESLTAALDTGKLNLGLQAGALGSIVELAAKSGRFSVVARPYMSTVNGSPVAFSAGREIPIESLTRDQTGTNTTSTTFRAVDLSLTVTPIVLPSGDYLVKVIQSNQEVIQSAPGTVPPIATQKIETTVMVRAGEVVALGGVSQDSAQRNAAGLPGIVRVPLLRRLGEVERSSRRREIVLLLSVGAGNVAVPANSSKPALLPPPPSFTPAVATERPSGLPSSGAKRERPGFLRRVFGARH